jgi:hypothetical protein
LGKSRERNLRISDNPKKRERENKRRIRSLLQREQGERKRETNRRGKKRRLGNVHKLE